MRLWNRMPYYPYREYPISTYYTHGEHPVDTCSEGPKRVPKMGTPKMGVSGGRPQDQHHAIPDPISRNTRSICTTCCTGPHLQNTRRNNSMAYAQEQQHAQEHTCTQHTPAEHAREETPPITHSTRTATSLLHTTTTGCTQGSNQRNSTSRNISTRGKHQGQKQHHGIPSTTTWCIQHEGKEHVCREHSRDTKHPTSAA